MGGALEGMLMGGTGAERLVGGALAWMLMGGAGELIVDYMYVWVEPELENLWVEHLWQEDLIRWN